MSSGYRYDIASNSFKSLEVEKYVEKGKSFFGVSKNFYRDLLCLPVEKRNEWLASKIVTGILGEGTRPFEKGLDMQNLQETLGYYLLHFTGKDEFTVGKEMYSRGFGNPFTNTSRRYDMATLQNFNGNPHFYGIDVDSEKFNAYHRVLNFENLIDGFKEGCSKSFQNSDRQYILEDLEKIKEQYNSGYYDICRQKVFEALSNGSLSPDFILQSRPEVISSIITSSGKYEKQAELESKVLYNKSIKNFKNIVEENSDLFKREQCESDADFYFRTLCDGLKQVGGLKALWQERTSQLSVSEKVKLSRELGITPNGNYEPLDTPKYVLNSFENGLECGEIPEEFKNRTDEMCQRAKDLQSAVPNIWREYIIDKMMENSDKEITVLYPAEEVRLSFIYGELDEDMSAVYSKINQESTSLMKDGCNLKFDIRNAIKETVPPLEDVVLQ